MTQAEVREPVGSMVLTGRSKWQQATASAGDRNEERVKNRDAENQYRDKPGVRKLCAVRSDFQPKRSHQKTKEHRAAITHEDFRRIEIPAQKSKRSAQSRSAQSAHQRLTIHRS